MLLEFSWGRKVPRKLLCPCTVFSLSMLLIHSVSLTNSRTRYRSKPIVLKSRVKETSKYTHTHAMSKPHVVRKSRLLDVMIEILSLLQNVMIMRHVKCMFATPTEGCAYQCRSIWLKLQTEVNRECRLCLDSRHTSTNVRCLSMPCFVNFSVVRASFAWCGHALRVLGLSYGERMCKPWQVIRIRRIHSSENLAGRWFVYAVSTPLRT
jgi:hypothetical protein